MLITSLLLAIFGLILVLPLLFKQVEHNLELFLLVIGAATLTLSHFLGPEPLWSRQVVLEAITEPVKLAVATLAFGLLFRSVRDRLRTLIADLEERIGPRRFAFLLILVLGLVSSVITAIISALVLCEVVSAINLDKKYETRLVIFACFSIGMGAALTPIGEPLSTIAVAKLRGGPLGGDFLMLLRLFGAFILPGIAVIAAVGGFLRGTEVSRADSLTEDFAEPLGHIALRAGKVYLFVAALVLLGTGFKPLIDSHISKMPSALLYWVNMTSAILDNATLAAAELGPHMAVAQVKSIILGIVISGGMLIPGNIPNIISANKLKISSRDWALAGAPFGLALMAFYFGMLYWK